MSLPGPDPIYPADESDPYVAWARSVQPDDVAPSPIEASPDLIPVPSGAPAPTAPGAAGSALPTPDPYAAWAGGPVTSPIGPPAPIGPITSPDQLPGGGGAMTPAGPITDPGAAPATSSAPNAYGGQDAFGGDINPADRAKALETMTPEDRAAAVQSMTPDEFVAYKSLRNRQMVLKQAELEHQATADSERRAREDLEIQRDAVAKAQADTKDVVARADAIANTKIDPSRYVNGLRDRGHFGLAVVMMGLGGLASAETGGRNLALDQFNKGLDNDIAAQHADIQNRWRANDVRKNAIAEEYARTGDLYKAQETYRVAAYQSAINAMQSTLQQFDPAGGTAVAIRDNMDQFHTAQAQAIQAFGQQQLKNRIDVAEQDRKIRETASVIAKNAAETAKIYADASQAKEKDQVFSPAELAAIHPGAPVPPIGMNLKDYKTWIDTHKAGQEAALGEREYGIGDMRPVKDADGNVVGSKSVPFVNADGKPYRAPSPKEAEAQRKQKAGVDTTAHFIDEMTAGIKKYGGSTEFFKSPEWQTMKANGESLLFALHQAYGVEGFRPGVLEQMEKALGGQDPTKLTLLETNAIPGLEAAKAAVVAHFNSNLRAMEYTGKEYSPPTAEKAESFPTFSDRTDAESAPGPLDKMGAGLRQDADALRNPFELNPSPDTAPDQGPRLGPTGLSLEDTSKVEDLVKRYNKGTPVTKAKVVEALSAPLTAGRPTLNTGILGLVNGESPELYHQLLQALPAGERERWLRDQAAVSAMQAQLPGGKR